MFKLLFSFSRSPIVEIFLLDGLDIANVLTQYTSFVLFVENMQPE